MGLLDKFNKAMDGAREAARGVQDDVEAKLGQGMRAASGQGGAPLPSNREGRDVFAPLVAAANGLGYAYVARSESIDGVGWTLHSNRLGLEVNERDQQTGGVRTTVEALNKPMSGLVDWEIAKQLVGSGADEERAWAENELARFFTRAVDEGWESSFLRRRMVVRVRMEGPTATEHLARDFAGLVCWRYTDWAAAKAWCAELGVDDAVDIQTEVVAGVHTVAPAAPPPPPRLALTIPMAADLAGATIDAADPTRVIQDWDEFAPGEDQLGWAPTGRAAVRCDGWEGWSWSGPAGQFAQVFATDCPEAVEHPDRFAALLLDPVSRPPEFEGNTIATGLDPYGYPSAHVTIGSLPFVVRLSGPAGNDGGLDAVHRFAVAAILAMPG